MFPDARQLTPARLLGLYCRGLFPMGDGSGDGRLDWYCPDPRAILPLDAFHLPRRLRRTVRTTGFTVTVDLDFPAVMAGCQGTAGAALVTPRPSSWISPEIRALFIDLHRQGYAHSVECRLGRELVGGLYGLAAGGAFFGESMFSHRRDASKIALVHLVARLRGGGFRLLDVQFPAPHLQQFGPVTLPAWRFMALLGAALRTGADFLHLPPCLSPDEALAVLEAPRAPGRAPEAMN